MGVVRVRLVGGVILRIAVVMVMVVAVAMVGGRRATTSSDLSQEHPSADDHDGDRGHERGAADDDVRGDDIRRREHDGCEHRMPTVCDTLTAAPSPMAWRAEPRVPTRYAAINVLPCPGVRAMSRAECACGEERQQYHDRGQVGLAEDVRQVRGRDASRHGGRDLIRRGRGRW